MQVTAKNVRMVFCGTQFIIP